MHFPFKEMPGTPELSIYEKTFAKSDETDAILVVNGKKLHVNKALLSYHSEYFKALFNSEFKEKSMEEIEIKDVKFEDFATVLSLIQKNSIKLSVYRSNQLLELADRFMLPAATSCVKFLLYETSDLDLQEKIRLADKYRLEDLLDSLIASFSSHYEFDGYKSMELTDETKRKNLLSYHSDYFDVLFNSGFKEKSMDEIEIKDVDFEDFAIVLSLVHKNPIRLTEDRNLNNLLKLTDQFMLPAAKHYLELFISTIDDQLTAKFDEFKVA
uniref:BTB domain-containing protein n=2 Tax=Caenorhabditis tropicalis TaxID=1561998 RepID=A0A1I7UI51_9PELO